MIDDWLTLYSEDGRPLTVIRISVIDSVRFQPVVDHEGAQIAVKNVITGELEAAWQVLVMTNVGGHQLNFTNEEKARTEFVRIYNILTCNNPETNKGIN